jgi:hypothetical protein
MWMHPAAIQAIPDDERRNAPCLQTMPKGLDPAVYVVHKNHEFF